MTLEKRKEFRSDKLKATNKKLYDEASNVLRCENIDWLKCWREFSEASLSALDAEKMMWVDIMDRGKTGVAPSNVI